MDDIFTGFKTLEEIYNIFRNHLLLYLVFVKLHLSFKKMYIFINSIIAFGVRHFTNNIIYTKPEKTERICIFPIPKNQKEV